MSLLEFTIPTHDTNVFGGGGTDFIPVFERLEQLQSEGHKLDALIYFSDGAGTYPPKEPDYPTYFVMLEEMIQDSRLWGLRAPEWIKIVSLEVENG